MGTNVLEFIHPSFNKYAKCYTLGTWVLECTTSENYSGHLCPLRAVFLALLREALGLELVTPITVLTLSSQQSLSNSNPLLPSHLVRLALF